MEGISITLSYASNYFYYDITLDNTKQYTILIATYIYSLKVLIN